MPGLQHVLYQKIAGSEAKTFSKTSCKEEVVVRNKNKMMQRFLLDEEILDVLENS